MFVSRQFHPTTKFEIYIFCIFLYACQKSNVEIQHPPVIPDFAYLGGATTVFQGVSGAFTFPAPNLLPRNLSRHFDGDFSFDQIFVTSPALINPGLGPIFNNNSCAACHVQNGKSPPAKNGQELSGFLLRISLPGTTLHGGPLPVPHFGTQLQTRAVQGQFREANFTYSEIQSIVTFVDGHSVKLTQPIYKITEPYQSLPQDVQLSPRIAPPVFGLGLLSAIPEAHILALADELDTDGDGISGKPNWVWDVEKQKKALGRFGWKAESPTALQQTAEAYHQDMGLTSSLFPKESCFQQSNCSQNLDEVEISNETLESTAFYFLTLAVPAMRNYNDEQVIQGKILFDQIQCNKCHVNRQHTDKQAFILEYSDLTFYPYTDLLLHDMGEGLADHRPSFSASGREWRTPPLWGIGLIPLVNGHSRYLHDGRANSIEEAILWHGGEAEPMKQNYMNLSAEERQALLAFLHAL